MSTHRENRVRALDCTPLIVCSSASAQASCSSSRHLSFTTFCEAISQGLNKACGNIARAARTSCNWPSKAMTIISKRTVWRS
eukprot:4278383-Pleurochrysis_carterae.AAC.1